VKPSVLHVRRAGKDITALEGKLFDASMALGTI
jgi:hypothetical protein